MQDIALAIIIACIGSTGLSTFIQFLINRKDSKKDKIKKFEQSLHEIELDTKRTQLLLLIASYPSETGKIVSVAEKYFKPASDGGLEGDWYMSTMFTDYCDKYGVTKPSWFKE